MSLNGPAIRVQTLKGIIEKNSCFFGYLGKGNFGLSINIAWAEHPSTLKLNGILQLVFLSETETLTLMKS